MKSINKITTGIIALAVGIGIIPKYAKADFFEAIQTPTKGQVQLISTLSKADKLVNNEGNNKDIDLDRITNNLTFKFKDKGVFIGGTIPHVSVKNYLSKESVSGFGDPILETGPYFRIGNDVYKVNLLPTAGLKASLGEYDASRKLNAGTGQSDLSAMLRATFQKGNYIADAGIGATHRFGKPTDAVNARLTLGYGNKNVKAGIENIGTFARDGTRNIKTSVQAGYYNPEISLIARVGVDTYSRASAKGYFFGFTARKNL